MKKTIDDKFEREVLTSVKNENDIVFISYSGIEDTENKIKFALGKILEKYKKEELFTPILSCIKELIANSTKANAKKILIEEGEINNPDDPVEVVEKIRKILNESALLEYGIKAKERKLSSRIYLKQIKGNLVVEVINNVPLTAKEEKKILNKISKSSKYDNIAEFFMENPDPEAEGMGLGLSMIVVLLKNIDLSYRNFGVRSDQKSKTYARITIPMT